MNEIIRDMRAHPWRTLAEALVWPAMVLAALLVCAL